VGAEYAYTFQRWRGRATARCSFFLSGWAWGRDARLAAADSGGEPVAEQSDGEERTAEEEDMTAGLGRAGESAVMLGDSASIWIGPG
jgi:hypothetical protein